MQHILLEKRQPHYANQAFSRGLGCLSENKAITGSLLEHTLRDKGLCVGVPRKILPCVLRDCSDS